MVATVLEEIQEQTKDLEPNTATELLLDRCRMSVIDPKDAQLLEQFTELEVLSLIGVGLTSLDNFPQLPALRQLELSDNKLSSGLAALKASTNLIQLNLSGNLFKDLKELEPLSVLENLLALDLFGCDVTKSPDYRDTMFRLIPSLLALDGFDAEGKEVELDQLNGDEEEEGEDGEEEEGEEPVEEEEDAYEEEEENNQDEEGEEDSASSISEDELVPTHASAMNLKVYSKGKQAPGWQYLYQRDMAADDSEEDDEGVEYKPADGEEEESEEIEEDEDEDLQDAPTMGKRSREDTPDAPPAKRK